MKNELCTVVPHPDSHLVFLRTTLANGLNQMRWGQDPDLQVWLGGARLNGFEGLAGDGDAEPEILEQLKRFGENALPAAAKLQAFLAEIDETPKP